MSEDRSMQDNPFMLKRSRALALWYRFNRQPALLSITVFLIGLAVYVPTLAPGLLWGGGDFAAIQARIALLAIDPEIHGHPLYTLAAHPFTWLPIGDVAYRANLSAAVFSALALAVLFRLVAEAVASTKAALLAALALLVSHTFWTYAVMPKSYSLNSLLLVTVLYLLLSWGRTGRNWLLITGGSILGLASLSHTLFMLFPLGPLVYVYRLGHFRRRSLLLFALAYIAGLVPFVVLTVLGGEASATSIHSIGFASNLLQVVTQPAYWPTGLIVFVGALVYQFPLTWVIGLIGLPVLWRRNRPFFWLLLLTYLADVAFTWSWLPATPRLSDYVQNFHFYLPSYVIFAVWMGYGFDAVLRRRVWSAFAQTGLALIVALSPVALYAAAPHVADPIMTTLNIRSLPGRDAARYLFSPWKHREDGARRLGESILAALPEKAVLVADWSIYNVVFFLQSVERRRPDVALILLDVEHQGETLGQLDPTRPLFIPDIGRYYDLQLMRKWYSIVPDGPIYRLVPHAGSSLPHVQPTGLEPSGRQADVGCVFQSTSGRTS